MIGAALMGLAQLAPAILPFFSKNETANKAAGVVSEVAKAVTGGKSDDEALEALKADPAKVLEYQNAMNAHAATMYAEETKRLESVNETMRKESASSDSFVRRARPFLVWAIGGSVVLEVLLAALVVLYAPEQMGSLSTLFSAIAVPQSIAAAMCGVYIKERSKDKQVNAGMTPAMGLFESIAAKIAK